MIQIRFFSGLLLFAFVGTGQIHAQNEHHHHHEGHPYEIGLSLGAAQLEPDGERAFGGHLHGMRRFGDEGILRRFSAGIGVEILLTEHPHYSFMGTLAYNPLLSFILDVSPGIVWTEHEGETESHFLMHIEMLYEFDFHAFGLGPLIGMAMTEAHNHYMIGLYIGKAF